MRRARIRRSKTSSVMGLIVGVAFVGIGLVLVIPATGVFGVFWTAVSAILTIFHAVNAFSDRGIATTEIEIEGDNLSEAASPSADLPFDERLRRLEQLRKEGLITEQEFQEKRKEVMGDEW